MKTNSNISITQNNNDDLLTTSVNNKSNQNGFQISPSGFLDTANTALYLGLSEKTIATWRCLGKGIPFKKIGNRVMYAKTDIDNWLEQQKLYTSTSQARG